MGQKPIPTNQVKLDVHVLDTAENICCRASTTVSTLHTARVGLEHLYLQTRSMEEELHALMRPALVTIVYNAKSNPPTRADLLWSLVACNFNHYAVALCNYVKLVGWIGHEQDASRPVASQYVQEVIPAVLTYRDKIGAHFARASRAKDKRDNEAERSASVWSPIYLHHGRAGCGGGSLTITEPNGKESTAAFGEWSLTLTHEELAPRFWPLQNKLLRNHYPHGYAPPL
jgi:hypothetical protein